MKKKRKTKKGQVFSKPKIKKLRFAIYVALILLTIDLYINGCFAKLMCLIKEKIYVEPTAVSMVLFFLLVLIFFVRAADSSRVRERNKRREVIKITAVAVISAIVLAVNFTCVNYIDGNGLRCDGVYYKDSEILEVEAEVDRISATFGSKAIVYDYYIACKFKTESKDFVFVSDNFYSYESLYDFLRRMDGKLSKIDKSKFDDLVNYEERRLLFKSATAERIRWIRQIEKLK